MNDHIVLTVNGLVVYESHIGTKPPPDPIKPPEPPPVIPPRSTVNYSLYAGLTRAQAEWQGLDRRVPGWSWAEFEASGFMEPDGIFSAAPAEPTNVIANKHHPYRVELHKGDEQHFSVPTYPGEEVTLILLEVQGTPDSLQTNSYVTDDRGRLLAGPTYFGRHGSHTFKAQSAKSFLSVTATESGPIGIQRN